MTRTTNRQWTGNAHPKETENRRRGKAVFEENWGVYVLRCENPGLQYLPETAKSRIGDVPQWAVDAAHYANIYYVGHTQDIFKRIGDHMHYGAAKFTKLFRPTSVVEVKLCRDRTSARELESQLPRYYRDWERRYVYSDLTQDEAERCPVD